MRINMYLTVIQKFSIAIANSLMKKEEALRGLKPNLTQGEIKELFVGNILRPFLNGAIWHRYRDYN